MSFAKNGEIVRLNMQIFIIVSALILSYIIFIAAPSVVAYYSVFSRKATTPFHLRKSLGYYAEFADKIESSRKYLAQLNKCPITIKSYDGVSLYADYYDGGFDKTAICVHGYASGPDYNFAVQGEFLYKAGFNLLFINQRAHDKSGGSRIGFGLLEQYDIISWVNYLKSNTDCRKILLYGISMGCAAVSYASSKLDKSIVRAMILDCGFTSPYDQFKHDYKLRRLPYRLMLPYMEALAKIGVKINIKEPVSGSLKQTEIPAFFLHGTADQTVPIEQGKINYTACSSEKQCAFIPNGNHTVSFMAGGETLQKQLEAFINNYF